ncbi:MAG: hypothetical protein OEM91_10855 [Hyphomicrobiales bacterium]|nr:hypothetical protein [Hyphomicrobiales bacterium]
MRYRKLKRGGDDKLTELISSGPGEQTTRLEKMNDFLFLEHWKEGETPFTWRKQWATLTLEILSAVSRDKKPVAAPDDAHVARQMTVPLHAHCSSLKAKKSIRLIDEGASYLSLNVFSEFDVTINAIDENHRMGSIFHIDSTLTRYASDKDHICISSTVPLAWLKDIHEALAKAGQGRSVELDFNIHCFSREYERYSVEPDLHEKYSLERGGTGYAFLAEVRAG